ncbi:unnamed protein product [Calypogeia fissa]
MEDLYNIGERWLKTAASTTSNIAFTTSAIVTTSGVKALGYIGSPSGRPEVPARAAVAAAVARQIAALPPHERLSLSSTSLGTPSIYGVKPSVKAEELGEDFYEEGFDPIRHMLENLPAESNDLSQQYFDTKGGEKLLQLDMITERLSKQVVENHEEMVKGMQLVTELDRDLQLSSIICKNGRRFLSMAAQEVTQDLVVAENVKKKQVLLNLLPVLERIQLAIETKSRLNSTMERGDYALALQLCSESALLLEECSDLKAIIDVNHSLEDWLQRTIESVDKILLTVCHKFNPDKYSSVLLAYVVLDDIPGLAEKAQTFYAQIIVSETHAVARNLLFQGQDPQILLRKTRIPYNDLCAQLSEAKFKECLHRSLEVLFDLLSSYYNMMTWKPVLGITTATDQISFRVPKHDAAHSNGEAYTAGEGRSAREDLQEGSSARVRDATLVISGALERGRKTVWELSARRVAVLLSCEALCTTSPHQFLQSLDWVTKFILAGEAFCGVEAMTLRAKLVKQSEKYYWSFHRQNLEVLRVILGREVWQQLNSTILKTLHLSSLSYGTPVLRRSDGLESSTGGTSKPKELENLQLTKRENPSSRASFDNWVRRGNPFIDRKVGNIVSGTADENGKVKSGEGSYQQGHPQDVRAGDEEGEDEDLLADFIDEDSQLPGRLEIEHMQNSAKVSQSYESSLILTTSAVNLLRYMEKYIKLMQILQPIVSEVFRGLCQLFELYFFTVFKVFGNRDFLSTPLRSALVRISQGLEEQRVQLPPSPKRTSSTGPPSSPGNSALSGEASSAGVTMLPMVPSNLFALKERAAAVESLLCLTQILQNSHLDLKTMLPQDTLAYMEQFLNETVGLVPDLRVHIYKVAARLVLNLGGYIDRIANARWELKELGVEHNGYVDLLLGEFKQYSNKLFQASVHMEVRDAMLEYGVDVVAETILDGLSRVKKCNNEGRALMSLDLQVLINGLRHLAPQKLKSNLLIVETYVKAFYLPETEYLHWIRAHPEYSKGQVVGLINLVASTYNWKRKTKMDLLEKIESGDA